LETCFKLVPVASLIATTAAPVTTAPDLSKIVPLNSEVEVWAKPRIAQAKPAAARKEARTMWGKRMVASRKNSAEDNNVVVLYREGMGITQ
jgi:hypothetical protein